MHDPSKLNCARDGVSFFRPDISCLRVTRPSLSMTSEPARGKHPAIFGGQEMLPKHRSEASYGPTEHPKAEDPPMIQGYGLAVLSVWIALKLALFLENLNLQGDWIFAFPGICVLTSRTRIEEPRNCMARCGGGDWEPIPRSIADGFSGGARSHQCRVAANWALGRRTQAYEIRRSPEYTG